MKRARSILTQFRLAALLLGGLCAIAAFAAERAVASTIPSQTALAVYRFYSKADLNESSLAIYQQQNGLFYPKQIGRVQFDFRKALVSKGSYEQTCDNLLEHLQNFSLHVYQSSKYLTAEQERAQGAERMAARRE